MTVKIPCMAAPTLVLSAILCPYVAAQEVSSLPLFPSGSVDSSANAAATKDVVRADVGDLPSKPTPMVTSNSVAAPSIHVTPPADSPVRGVVQHPFRAWVALSLAGQAAVLADAKTTLDLRHSYPLTFREDDPLARPFVNLPTPAYIASSVGLSAGLSLLAWRLNRSENSWLRHHWWLPQVAQTALNAECAVHNSRQ